jgi:hypothetical protein
VLDVQATKYFKLHASFGSSLALRHRMLHFIQNLYYYMTFEVGLPSRPRVFPYPCPCTCHSCEPRAQSPLDFSSTR